MTARFSWNQRNSAVVDRAYSRFRSAGGGVVHFLDQADEYTILPRGTSVEIDVHDYPMLFFRNLKELRDILESRLKALQASTVQTRTPTR